MSPYDIEFSRLVASGMDGTRVPPAAPENKSAQKSSKKAAAALDVGSWQA